MKEIPEHIREWYALHPDQEEEFARLMQLWSDSGEVLAQPEFDTSKAWQAMESRLGKKKGSWARMPPAGKIAVAAAMIGVLVLAGGRIFSRRIPRDGTTGWNSVAAIGANRKITLPDGSTVALRKGARLKYPSNFQGDERMVMLAGEAFFDIHPEKGRPFRITTTRSMTEVLGTSFLVNASSSSDRIIVTTGRVLFTDKGQPERNCMLTEKQEAVLSEKGLEKKQVTAACNYLSWQTGDLIFAQTPLDQVAEDLSDHYGVQVRLADTLIPKAGLYKITSEFTNQTLLQALEEINVLTRLRYKKKADTIIICQP